MDNNSGAPERFPFLHSQIQQSQRCAGNSNLGMEQELSHNLSSLLRISCFQLAWLDGVIKMTDDERTDLKPQEEEEGEEVRSKPVIPMLNHLPEESVQVIKSINIPSTFMMTSLNMVRHDLHDYI